MRVALGFLLTALICLIGFNNCGQFKPALSSFVKAASNCLSNGNSAKSKAAGNAANLLPHYEPSVACSAIENYQCFERVFKPNVGNSESVDKICISSSIGPACLMVQVTKFDTALNADLPNTQDESFKEGGGYNRVEYQCLNNQVLMNGVAVFQTEADSLDSAFASVVGKCQSQSL